MTIQTIESLDNQNEIEINETPKKDESEENLTNKVLKSFDEACTKAAVSALEKMPNWKPAKQGGIATRVQFNLPVNFKIRH